MERQTKTVRQLLASKHSEVSGVISVTPSDTVLFALKLMREKDIGAVIVLDGRQLKGILSERDYAREVELEGRTAKDCLVQQIMTERTIFYARAGDSMVHCQALMKKHRVRHLPVYEDGEVIGVLSIRDVLEEIIAEEEHVIRELEADRLVMTTDTGAY